MAAMVINLRKKKQPPMNKKEKLPLSVAVITLNEEDRLPDCLKSVSFADDIVVVDSGSTDNTIKIAEIYDARVFKEKWHGFGPQKQLAIDQCVHDWVLILDADERIPEQTAAEIYTLFAEPMKYAAYSFPRKNYFSGKWIRHGGWWPDRVVRLFNKRQCRMQPSIVHESLETMGSVEKILNPIAHHTNNTLKQSIEKMNRYSTAGAEQLYSKGVNASLLMAVLRAAWSFFHKYFLRLGFLDGFYGMNIAVTDAVSAFFKYAKLIEMKKEKGTHV